MPPPIWTRGRVFGGPEGVPFGPFFGPFFGSTFDFYETLKRYENRHLSVSEPSEDAFFGSFPKLDFRSKKAPRCFVYRHFSDFRSLRKDVFWSEKGVILSRFRGTRKVAKMLIYKASGRFLRFHFYCFFVVFAFPRFILKHYVYNCFSDFWPSQKGGSRVRLGEVFGVLLGPERGDQTGPECVHVCQIDALKRFVRCKRSRREPRHFIILKTRPFLRRPFRHLRLVAGGLFGTPSPGSLRTMFFVISGPRPSLMNEEAGAWFFFEWAYVKWNIDIFMIILLPMCIRLMK